MLMHDILTRALVLTALSLVAATPLSVRAQNIESTITVIKPNDTNQQAPTPTQAPQQPSPGLQEIMQNKNAPSTPNVPQVVVPNNTTQTKKSTDATKLWAPFQTRLCITPQGNKMQRGTALVLDDCTKAMLWTYDPNRDMFVLDASKFDGAKGELCMDVSRANPNRGTNVQIWDCNGTNAQKWDARKIILTKDRYHVVNMIRGLCLDASGGKLVRGARMITWDCHGGQNQIWGKNF